MLAALLNLAGADQALPGKNHAYTPPGFTGPHRHAIAGKTEPACDHELNSGGILAGVVDPGEGDFDARALCDEGQWAAAPGERVGRRFAGRAFIA